MQALDRDLFEGFAIDLHDQLLAESVHLKDQQVPRNRVLT